uniref:DDE-1 domain-containing protein n=1 Tax=Globodera rostochiensis TaxID=31243 RepID=A0A914HP41_GLORO
MTIYRWKRKLGQTKPNKHSHSEQKELMKRYYEIKDKNPEIRDEDIAKMLKIGGSTLYKWKKQFKRQQFHPNSVDGHSVEENAAANVQKIGNSNSGSCTKFVQAADVSWNAPFKAKIRQQYEDWMLHGEKTTTSSGNTRAAPMNIYLNWIHEAWEGIPKENISKSFKTCGITNAFDGSEDGEIHCFKEDGPVPNGMLRLQQAREMAEFDFLAEGKFIKLFLKNLY